MLVEGQRERGREFESRGGECVWMVHKSFAIIKAHYEFARCTMPCVSHCVSELHTVTLKIKTQEFRGEEKEFNEEKGGGNT